MEKYEINEDTLAIIPIDEERSRIIELDSEYTVENSAYSIMEDSCEYYGSSYLGRMYAARKILNCSYKVPILVEESESIIFFPTKSALESDCCWINVNAIKSYKKEDKTIKLCFVNNQEIILKISKLMIDNQVSKAILLESTLRKRKKGKKD